MGPYGSWEPTRDMVITQVRFGENLGLARQTREISLEAAAAAVHLSEDELRRIELGERKVTSLEFDRLGTLYEKKLVDFFVFPPPAERMVGRLYRSVDRTRDAAGARTALRACLRVYNAATTLWDLSGAQPPPAPIIEMPAPGTLGRAIAQGRAAAARERRRLRLGVKPVVDLWTLLQEQGVGVAVVTMPRHVSGVMLAEDGDRPYVVVNRAEAAARRNFSLAHEYGHVLLDRTEATGILTQDGSSDLREVRANAFASAFLVPEAGVKDYFARRGPSGTPRAREAVSAADVLAMADEYRVSRVAVLRTLRRMGYVDGDGEEN